MIAWTKFRAVAAGLGMAAALLGATGADAALFTPDGLDPSFCEIKPFRQTVVYVDDMMMTEGKLEWAHTIYSKLKSSLMPGELVTIVQLSPSKAHATEIGHACWPDFTEQRRAELLKGTYIFSSNPLATLDDQQKYFAGAIDQALSKIWDTAKRPDTQVQINRGKPPEKQIIRALSSDEGRFANSSQTIRAIVYSDMMENSDLGSVFRPQSVQPINFGDKLGSHLRKSVFYVFGVAEDVAGPQSIQEDAKVFWTRAMKYMTASVGGFGSDLNIPNRVPITGVEYNLDLEFKDNQKLDGRLSVLSDRDGNMVDSWLLISRLGISPIDGTYRCKNGQCKLDGVPKVGIITDSVAEMITLSGSEAQLDGQIGVQGSTTSFTLTAAAIN